MVKFVHFSFLDPDLLVVGRLHIRHRDRIFHADKLCFLCRGISTWSTSKRTLFHMEQQGGNGLALNAWKK